MIKREKAGNGRRTEIVKHAIALDKFTLMNVTYAKQHFSEKTICEVIEYLSVQLLTKLPKHIIFPSQWHKFKFMWTELSKSINTKTTTYFLETHAMFDYLIAVHGLFI